jgi:PhnB protein
LLLLVVYEVKIMAMSRVNTYLNFGQVTEEAFNFYKSVFGGEFSLGGISRFADIPESEGMPHVAEEDKNLVMHIELPILGGHILMGTDAPNSMGFNLNFGNNVHINLEPDTRTETKRLFDKLSAGGKITMELQDVFWGSYFGTCTDKFGVQWMFTCNE